MSVLPLILHYYSKVVRDVCKLGRVDLVVTDASIHPILPAKQMYYCILTVAVVSTVALGWM